MPTQRSLAALRQTAYYRQIAHFGNRNPKFSVTGRTDGEQDNEMVFGTDVTASQREDIRQICRHLDLSFKCVGSGTQKKIVVTRPDYAEIYGPDWDKVEEIGTPKIEKPLCIRFTAGNEFNQRLVGWRVLFSKYCVVSHFSV
jgi:hypothetical protein